MKSFTASHCDSRAPTSRTRADDAGPRGYISHFALSRATFAPFALSAESRLLVYIVEGESRSTICRHKTRIGLRAANEPIDRIFLFEFEGYDTCFQGGNLQLEGRQLPFSRGLSHLPNKLR